MVSNNQRSSASSAAAQGRGPVALSGGRSREPGSERPRLQLGREEQQKMMMMTSSSRRPKILHRRRCGILACVMDSYLKKLYAGCSICSPWLVLELRPALLWCTTCVWVYMILFALHAGGYGDAARGGYSRTAQVLRAYKFHVPRAFHDGLWVRLSGALVLWWLKQGSVPAFLLILGQAAFMG